MRSAEEVAMALRQKVNDGICGADDFVEALNAFADSRLEEAAKILTDDANNTSEASLTYRQTAGSPNADHFRLRAEHSLFLAAQVKSLKSTGTGER